VSAHGVPAFDHVYLIMMENESQSAITTALAPYINSLMTTYAYTNNYSTSYHPSLPNYIDITSGTNQDIDCDCDPNASETKCTAGSSLCLSCNCGGITAQHLGDQLDAVNVEWRNYGEGMGTACNLTASEGGNATHFAPKHVPFMYYADVGGNATKCAQRAVDYSSFATDLAAQTYRFSMIAPNLCDDMHGDTGCPTTNEVTQGDNWLKTEVPKILATPGFQPGGKDVLFIVWDEQTGSTGGANIPMLCIPIGPLVKAGTVSVKAYTHESLLATFEEAFGLARLANAAQVPSPINDVWK
jgi:phosphatidylinositol-3-phosphatase